MAYLFDASALVELIPKGNIDATAIASGHALDLTFYETANAFWKAWRVRRAIEYEGARKSIQALEGLKRVMVVHGVQNTDLALLLGLARETGLTIYDSAYIAVAEMEALELVTNDEKLKRAASPRIDVRGPSDI